MEISYAAQCVRPGFIQAAKGLRGSRGQGLAFEKAVLSAVRLAHPQAIRGQWWQYTGDGVPRWCQTDLILETSKNVWIFECKLTRYKEGLEQLEGLYLPVLRAARPEKRVHGIIVLKYLTGLPPKIEPMVTLDAALRFAGPLSHAVLHYLGRGPL